MLKESLKNSEPWRSRGALFFVLAILVLNVASPARAQTTTGSNRPSGSSILEQRAKPKEKAPRDVKIKLPDQGGAAEPEGSARTDVVLAGVQIEGATVYSEDELARIYEPYLGRLFTAADAEKIIAAINAKYQQDGYVLSRAIALPQNLDFGILRIDVAEGFIESVVFEGPVQARKSLLLGFVEKLKAVRPLTQVALERYVMLMDDLPGLSVRPALRALEGRLGAHELLLRLTQDDFQGFASIDNKSTRTVGRRVAQISGTFNSPLGQYESTALAFYTVPEDNRELLFLEGRQEYTLNAEGTLVGISGWHSVSESGEGDKPLDLDSFDTRAAVYLVYPVIRARQRSLFMTATFEYHDTEETAAGVNNYDDRLRTLRLKARGFVADSAAGENIVVATVSRGLDILDASKNGAANLSRTGGKNDFSKIDAFYTRYQALPGPWSAELGLKGQLVSNGVLSAEEFRAGGGNFGRAYDPSEISGDYGAAGYLELQYNLAARNSIFRGTQAFGFYDLAAAWDNDPVFGTSKISIASAGAGMRMLLPKDVRMTLEVAKPLTEPVFAEGAGGKDTRIFMSLNVGF